VRGAQDTTWQRSTCSRPQSYRLDVITCIAVKEATRRPPMYRIGSYQYVFRPCHPPGEPRRLDTWSECTADVQSARLGPDGISREYRRGRSGIPVSRLYLRNVARCTVEGPSKRPPSYMPKLSNDAARKCSRPPSQPPPASRCIAVLNARARARTGRPGQTSNPGTPSPATHTGRRAHAPRVRGRTPSSVAGP